MNPTKVLFVLFLAIFGGACATTGPPPMRPCIEARAAVPIPDPCAGLDPAACEVRMAFVRRVFASTVYVHVSRYAPAEGMTYAGGTGAVIDDRGHVLTAWHVVRDARLVVVATRTLADNGRDTVRVRDVPMEVVAFDRAYDVALLRPVPGEKLPAPLPVLRTPLAVGAPLWHFGNVSVWQSGRVTGLNRTRSDIPGLTEVDFPCRHGDSGGPFVTPDGELVGVLLSMSGTRDGEGHTFFLPVADAFRLLGYH